MELALHQKSSLVNFASYTHICVEHTLETWTYPVLFSTIVGKSALKRGRKMPLEARPPIVLAYMTYRDCEVAQSHGEQPFANVDMPMPQDAL